MKKHGWMTTGGFFASVLSVVCCIGPLILAALGLGLGVVNLFAPFRLFFIILTVIFLALAFFYTYRKKKVTCEDGSVKCVTGSKTAKVTLWIITVLAIVLMAFPYWFPLISGNKMK